MSPREKKCLDIDEPLHLALLYPLEEPRMKTEKGSSEPGTRILKFQHSARTRILKSQNPAVSGTKCWECRGHLLLHQMSFWPILVSSLSGTSLCSLMIMCSFLGREEERVLNHYEAHRGKFLELCLGLRWAWGRDDQLGLWFNEIKELHFLLLVLLLSLGCTCLASDWMNMSSISFPFHLSRNFVNRALGEDFGAVFKRSLVKGITIFSWESTVIQEELWCHPPLWDQPVVLEFKFSGDIWSLALGWLTQHRLYKNKQQLQYETSRKLVHDKVIA